jgi:Domain of unknown function (DUF4340)
MTRENQIAIGGVILVALGAGTYFQMKKDEAVGKTGSSSSAMPDVKAPEDVDKISIVNGEKGEVVLEKKGDKWALTKPLAFAANQQNVKSLVDNLKEIKAEELISSNATDEQKKLYEVDAAKGVHVIAYKGADKKVDITFGKSGGRGQMTMIDGKPGVYAVKGYSSYLYARETKNWRDTEIFKFDDATATQVAISNKNGVFSFTKGDKWAGSFKGAAITRLDETKVSDALRAVKNLSADDFGDGKTPAETGLDAPEGTMTVTLKDNAGSYVLKVGKVSSGTSRYAMKDGSPTVFIISSWPSEWAVADVTKFQRPADAGAPKDGGQKLEMPPGMGGMGGMPPGMGGMGGMPPGMEMPEGHP